MSDPSQSGRQLMIPRDWTPAQAAAVLEFLVQLTDEVYLAYKQPLLAYARREALDLRLDDLEEPTDDPAPF